ncbi:MAG TPA: helix-turn-helix transcriptional regulator [Actinophytocola sp.]|uniref:helix-turn-helix domain-containing protein n=1 Tax=Actinophytocola sp. TaxID=1872138 RepID=UPI002DBA4464|nr:helix-turn-helix transcriptional regulator [Actinophytocola sp.]HEU5475433.1 helix-turn-helix transcriptional regulator [Actinophytocola sp.]
MSPIESTACTRELGNELKLRRKAAGLRGHDIATKLQWSATKVSRIETGQRTSDEVDVVFYLAHLGAKREDLDEILPLCRDAERGFWMSRQLRSLVFHESTAAETFGYEPLVLPGLLQTEDYARALIRQFGLGRDDVNRAVEIRMRRQRILRDPWRPVRAAFFVHEQVLHLSIGGNRVMNDQLLNLVLLSDQPNIDIRVVPRCLGEGSYFGPGFHVFYYSGHKPLVYQENGFNGLFMEDAEFVERYQARSQEITKAALDAEQSRVLLAALASEYDRLDKDVPHRVAEE